MGEKPSKESLREGLEEIAGALGERELPLDAAFLEEFCRITGHDYAACRERGVLPTGFLMTYTGPVVSEFFIGFFGRFPGVIKGVIHTASRLEVFRPVRLDGGPYRVRLEITRVEEKQGGKGNYFAADFDVTLLDRTGAATVRDAHQFFLRV